ncbi:hypothetical protein EAO71_10270 [Streptomyces sp. ms191]|nr:hypothetical protein EAO71_10270 [Streptomyces sp. ms191]
MSSPALAAVLPLVPQAAAARSHAGPAAPADLVAAARPAPSESPLPAPGRRGVARGADTAPAVVRRGAARRRRRLALDRADGAAFETRPVRT